MTNFSTGLVSAAFVFAAEGVLGIGCGGDDCTFTSECDNNVLKTCHKFTRDQQPQISTEDCGAENATCVEQGSNQASCVGNCDATFVTHCCGDILVYCNLCGTAGLIESIDCYAEYADCPYGYGYGGTCVDNGGGNAQCVPY
jgi:hypothetical protein